MSREGGTFSGQAVQQKELTAYTIPFQKSLTLLNNTEFQLACRGQAPHTISKHQRC